MDNHVDTDWCLFFVVGADVGWTTMLTLMGVCLFFVVDVDVGWTTMLALIGVCSLL